MKDAVVSGFPSPQKRNQKGDDNISMASSKSFRIVRKGASSIRGIVTNESKAKRKARKALEAKKAKAGKKAKGRKNQTSSLEDADSDDEEDDPTSLLSAVPSNDEVDQNDLLSPIREAKDLPFMSPMPLKVPSADSLQIVLLIMDPNSRRFELLQLEFDGVKSYVKDVLDQIRVSVSEETLKKQKYSGICDHLGNEMISVMKLSGFCINNDVIIAIPKGCTSKECAKLAKPILGDQKVVDMLNSSGIAFNLSPRSPRGLPIGREGKKTSILRKILTFLVLVGIAVGAQRLQIHMTAPINPGDVLSPGMWRSKCGLFSILPNCEAAHLKMTQSGELNLYGPDSEVVWTMQGGICDHDHPSCVSGAKVESNGYITIGGKPVSYYTVYGDAAELSPWPFSEQPNVRMYKGRK